MARCPCLGVGLVSPFVRASSRSRRSFPRRFCGVRLGFWFLLRPPVVFRVIHLGEVGQTETRDLEIDDAHANSCLFQRLEFIDGGILPFKNGCCGEKTENLSYIFILIDLTAWVRDSVHSRHPTSHDFFDGQDCRAVGFGREVEPMLQTLCLGRRSFRRRGASGRHSHSGPSERGEGRLSLFAVPM